MDDLLLMALMVSILEDSDKDQGASSVKAVRGLRGPRGDAFDFETYKEDIFNKIAVSVKERVDSFKLSDSQIQEMKLKFSDLTDDEFISLKGKKGDPGKSGSPGKDFEIDEHREVVSGMLQGFASSMREELRLKFGDLSAEEKNDLRFKFEDFTPEDLAILKGTKGARGAPGQKGRVGEKGENGRNGAPGIVGRSAPVVSTIKLNKNDSEISFEFVFSDGSKVKTNSIGL